MKKPLGITHTWVLEAPQTTKCRWVRNTGSFTSGSSLVLLWDSELDPGHRGPEGFFPHLRQAILEKYEDSGSSRGRYRLFHVSWTKENWLVSFKEDLSTWHETGSGLMQTGQPRQACSRQPLLNTPRVECELLLGPASGWAWQRKHQRVRACHAICAMAWDPAGVLGPAPFPSLELKAVSWKAAVCFDN